MTPYSDRLTPGTAIQYRSHGKFNRTWGGVHRPEKGLTISSVPGIGQGHERERPHVDVGFVSKQGTLFGDNRLCQRGRDSCCRSCGANSARGDVQVWVADPKGGMEFGAGAPLFARFAYTPEAIAELLADAATLMTDRAGRLRGVTRLHAPTLSDPLIIIVIDELAALTVFATEMLRRRQPRLRAGGFGVEWAAAALAVAGILATAQAVMLIAMIPAPPPGLVASQALATALAYPLAAFAARWLFGIACGPIDTRRISA